MKLIIKPRMSKSLPLIQVSDSALFLCFTDSFHLTTLFFFSTLPSLIHTHSALLLVIHILPSYTRSVGISAGLRTGDRDSRVRFPVGAGNFSLHHRVQNGSGTHPASYPMGNRGPLSGGKAAGA
jgi:hypothetical protein